MKVTMKYPDGSTSSTEAKIENNEMTFEHESTPGEIPDVTSENIKSGDEPADKALLSDGEGGTYWGEVSGGTQLYKHTIEGTYGTDGDYSLSMEVISESASPFTSFEELVSNVVAIRSGFINGMPCIFLGYSLVSYGLIYLDTSNSIQVESTNLTITTDTVTEF